MEDCTNDYKILKIKPVGKRQPGRTNCITERLEGSVTRLKKLSNYHIAYCSKIPLVIGRKPILYTCRKLVHAIDQTSSEYGFTSPKNRALYRMTQ